jgi:tetratricopeptide (TPR) repeat protein
MYREEVSSMRLAILSVIGATALASVPALAQDHHHQHGAVDFPISCSAAAQEHFGPGLAQLHHMMYDQARPHFEAAAAADPSCAMAHWGIAMASFQPLWNPTGDAGLDRGRVAVRRAQELGAPTPREQAHIEAVAAFFADPQPAAPDRPSDHQARTRAWMEAMRGVHERHRDDVDAAALYALASVAYAQTQFSPARPPDYSRQQRVGAILEEYLDEHPEHPGLHHYLIHAYDSPALAAHARRVAERYDALAPETPHALHMPSHITVRLGDWEATAELNERSAAAALRQADRDPSAMGHYVHALDYVMYAYLQMGDATNARRTLERVRAVEQVPTPFAFAYGAVAPQVRYYLEQGMWEEAAQLQPRQPAAVNWDAFPAADALFHYARGLGAARSGNLDAAEAERARIAERAQALRDGGDTYWAHLTDALGSAVEAWILYERGDADRALTMLGEAADLEDSMDKHPITPGEVLPVRELYGEMLLLEGRAADAQRAFEASLERTPKRRNALEGLRRAGAGG